MFCLKRKADAEATCTGLLCRLEHMQSLKADDMSCHPPNTLSSCHACMRVKHCGMYDRRAQQRLQGSHDTSGVHHEKQLCHRVCLGWRHLEAPDLK